VKHNDEIEVHSIDFVMLNVRKLQKQIRFHSWKNPPIILFLDYDGTLVDIQSEPSKATPTEELLQIIQQLSSSKNISVHIVSGREKKFLMDYFGDFKVGLHAEHGSQSRFPNDNTWVCHCPPDKQSSWKGEIKNLFDDFSRNIPGTFVEEKDCAIAWHYRNASEKDFTGNQANELKLHLSVYANSPFTVLYGNKVIEVCPLGINKGTVISKVQQKMKGQEAIYIAIGDDPMDEFMFSALPSYGISIHVGNTQYTSANYRFKDVKTVLEFLKLLAVNT